MVRGPCRSHPMKNGIGYRFAILSRLTRPLLLTGLLVFAQAGLASSGEIAAHRGGYALTPENTLAAFRSCAGAADLVEFDVRTSADGQFVVIHDETVDRTTSGTGRVAQLTLAQLKELDAGSKFSPAFAGERIPTLQEALQAVPPGIPSLLHFKAGSPAALVDALRAENALSNTIIYCDNHSYLRTIHLLEPDLPLCAGFEGGVSSNVLVNLRNDGIHWIAAYAIALPPPVVAMAHSLGISIQVSTSSVDLQPLYDLGFDRLLVADPHLASALLRSTPTPNPRLSRGLVAYWKMDDGLSDPFALLASDVELQSPGRLRHFDPPSWLPPEQARSGGALHLDGIHNHVLLPVNEALDIGTNTVTLSLWVRLASLPSMLSNTHACIYDSLIDAYSLYLDRDAQELRFKTTDTALSAARPGIPQSRLQTGVWHHVVGVYNGNAGPASGRAAIFLDGALQDVHTGADSSPLLGLTRPVRPGQAAVLGRNGSEDNYYFDGDVDDIALWRRALSPAEIRQIHQAGTNGIPLERLVLTLWIDNVYPDLETGDMHLDLRVEHGSLTNQPLRLRGVSVPYQDYVDVTVLEGGNGRSPRFQVPPGHLRPQPRPRDESSSPALNFFQVVCP